MSQAAPRRASGQPAWDWDAFPSETRRSTRAVRPSAPVRRASGPADPRDADVVPIRQPERRTIRITGQVPARPRRSRPARVRAGSRPDRFALWAVALGLFMAFLAAATAHGAEPAAVHHAANTLLQAR